MLQIDDDSLLTYTQLHYSSSSREVNGYEGEVEENFSTILSLHYETKDISGLFIDNEILYI
ncbi:MAG: hypothetical protein INQ03_02320 [Candidatus Heimdallarchaeota archaeon]|nr:hypothetical protein [Candidatus Heimdallarchaeota archaeon]